MREQAVTRDHSAEILPGNPIRGADLTHLEPDIGHGFFTREGGRSTGIYEGLNVGLGSRDDTQTVQDNRRLALAGLGANHAFLATLHQTHSSDIVNIEAPWHDATRPIADGAVTNQPGIVLGILTADCGPVLFADGAAGVVGAAHAGWKGAIGGVLENTIAAMEAIGARRNRIVAMLGPTISRDNYEVGAEFVDRFLGESPENKAYFSGSPKEGHAMFDLPAYILSRLRRAGLDPRWTGDCTYDEPARFYSFRRATHRGEPDYGRQLSAIMIRK
jgi:purine-nucleoside/S-methyl-5'-thioadenosine phosphorylase / adenosine deaminase